MKKLFLFLLLTCSLLNANQINKKSFEFTHEYGEPILTTEAKNLPGTLLQGQNIIIRDYKKDYWRIRVYFVDEISCYISYFKDSKHGKINDYELNTILSQYDSNWKKMDTIYGKKFINNKNNIIIYDDTIQNSININWLECTQNNNITLNNIYEQNYTTNNFRHQLKSIFFNNIIFLISIGIVLIAVKLLINRNKNKIKGQIGEKILSIAFTIKLDKTIYKQVNDIIVPYSKGTAQIDHVIVSKFGIFVIETKNFQGWIFGDEKSPEWTQSIYGRNTTFMNPIHQNYKHIKALSEYLNLPEEFFHNIVFFIGECEFKTLMPKNVLNRDITLYIKSFNNVILTYNEINEIYEKLKNLKNNPIVSKKEHIKNLKENKLNKKNI